jgi:hypothetical protein
MPADPPSDWTPPAFWHELDAGKPVIHVTQGTIANETPDLIAPALAGLAHEDVRPRPRARYATRDPLQRAVALVEKHAISARPRAQAAEATPRTDPATGT